MNGMCTASCVGCGTFDLLKSINKSCAWNVKDS
jgi:hypothetical protein